MPYYVHEPAKMKPRSQAHSEHYYGPFATREAAEKWKREKGLDIYPNVTITQTEPPDYKVVHIKQERRKHGYRNFKQHRHSLRSRHH